MADSRAGQDLGGVVGRSAVVIGGSRGIGRAVALALAREGADVLAIGRAASALAEVKAIARAQGFELRTARVDVGTTRSRAPLRRALAAQTSPDILVHAPGDFWEGPLSRLTVERWEALVRSNVTAALAVLREVLPGMRRRRYGRILLFGVAGADAPRAAPRAHAYRATKVALLTLARSVAVEEARSGITVNVILPGIIRAARGGARAAVARKIPAGRLGSPHEVARAALFLLAEESGYITGAALPVAGGYLL